jgi:DNA-binding transcriptional MocR family regulator
VLELPFRPDPARRTPVYDQLAGYLRGLVEAGRLLPGEKLPGSRELAAQLGLSRNTVNHAYQALCDAGVVTARVGQGTFVAARSGGPRALRGGDSRPVRGLVWEGLLSEQARRLEGARRSVAVPRGREPRFDFRGGRIAADALPQRELRRAWSRVVGERLAQIANPSDPSGWPPLREEIALGLVSRGIACEPEDVLVLSGAQQALDLVARALLDPGDAVALEDPGYFGAAWAFRGCGAQLVGVAVDGEGLRTDALARVLRSRRAKLVYTTPSAQFPTGAVLSEARREALLDLADEHHVPVFEDDYDSELRYGGPPLPALKTRDPAGRVIYVGTFSKALFPGLRLGYVVAARPLLARLVLAKGLADFGSDAVAQAVVAELLASGVLERHVRRLRKLNSARRAAMLAALEATMPEGVRWSEPRGGHTVWVTLPESVDPEALSVSAAEDGIAYFRGPAYSLDERGRRCLALAFVNHEPEAIAEGVERLALCVRRVRGGKAA